MMRRGFWLVAGAALGISGYRRASRVARSLTGQPGAVPGRPQAARAVQLRWRSPLALTLRPPGRATGALANRAGSPAPARRTESPAGFVQDLREGMAEYWDLHRGEQERRLGGHRGSAGHRAAEGYRPDGQRAPHGDGGRAPAGESVQVRREP